MPVLIVSISFWPGHMNADTLNALEAVYSGTYTDHHAPLLEAIWRAVYLTLGAGPGWVLVGQLLAFLAGAYLVLRVAFGRLGAASMAALIALSPPVFGMLGLLGRDVWFVALLLLCMGLSIRSAQSDTPQRWVLLSASAVAAWLALAARQNAVPAVAVALVVVVALGLRFRGREAVSPRQRRALSRWLVLPIVVGTALTALMVGSQVAARSGLDVRKVHAERALYLWDLAGISLRTERNLLPPAVVTPRGLDVITAHYSPDSVQPWFTGPPPNIDPFGPYSQAISMRKAWSSAVFTYPFAYLDTRVDMFARQLGVTRPGLVPFHPGIDSSRFGFRIRYARPNEAALDYLGLFSDRARLEGGVVYTVWVYLLVLVLAARRLLRRHQSSSTLMAGALALACLAYAAALFPTGVVVQYRLFFPNVVAALLTGAVVVRLSAPRLAMRFRQWHGARTTGPRNSA